LKRPFQKLSKSVAVSNNLIPMKVKALMQLIYITCFQSALIYNFLTWNKNLFIVGGCGIQNKKNLKAI